MQAQSKHFNKEGCLTEKHLPEVRAHGQRIWILENAVQRRGKWSLRAFRTTHKSKTPQTFFSAAAGFGLTFDTKEEAEHSDGRDAFARLLLAKFPANQKQQIEKRPHPPTSRSVPWQYA